MSEEINEKKLNLLKLNYEKLHEYHQNEIRTAWGATIFFLSTIGAVLGYAIVNKIEVGLLSLLFLGLSIIVLIHNLLGERLSWLNTKRERQLKKLEAFFTNSIISDNNLPEFKIHGIDFDKQDEGDKNQKGLGRCIGRNIKARWIYWIIFWLLLSLSVVFFLFWLCKIYCQYQ